MILGGAVGESIHLLRQEVPIELQKSFHGLRKTPLFFMSYCKKLNRKNKVQKRVLVCTLDHLYVCHPNGDIVRCVTYALIQRVIHDAVRQQMALVIPAEYDILVEVPNTHQLLHVIETLRSLHPFDEPLRVDNVERRRRDATFRVPALSGLTEASSSDMHATSTAHNGSVASSDAATDDTAHSGLFRSIFGGRVFGRSPKATPDAGAGAAGGPRERSPSFATQVGDLLYYIRRALPFLRKRRPGVIPNWNEQYYRDPDAKAGQGDHHRDRRQYRAQYEQRFIFRFLFFRERQQQVRKGIQSTNGNDEPLVNPQVFVDEDPFEPGENVAGAPNEVCIGRAPYMVQLAKPVGFRLCLYTGDERGDEEEFLVENYTDD